MNRRRKRLTNKVILSWVLIPVVMGVLFLFSSQAAAESYTLSWKITEMIFMGLHNRGLVDGATLDWEMANQLVRKTAHFLNYWVLGFLTINAFKTSGFEKQQSIRVTIWMCVLFAFLDEVHQWFVDGRGSSLLDVLIDSAGSFTGLMLYVLFIWNRPLQRLFGKLRTTS